MKKKSKKSNNNENDMDTCENINSYFQSKPTSISERAISLNEQYVLNVDGSKSNIVAQSSNNECSLLSLDCDLRVVNKITNDQKVRDLKISPNDDNLLYIAFQDGNIKLYDIRTNDFVREYKEELDTDRIKPTSSFDVAPNGKILCTGSERFQSHAFVIFYDQRVTKPLGGYWDSHTDEITQVKFHPDKSHKLITGSSDGLINLFDISEQTEEDALQYSLNTETLVDKIKWLSENTISCLSQEHELQLWNVDTADKLHNFSRESITTSMKRKSVADCYLVDTFKNKDDEIFLLGGSSHDKGNTLRSLNLFESELQPHADFAENKQMVRCCWNNIQNNLLVTGGESGIVNVWNLNKGSGSNDRNGIGLVNKKIFKMKLHQKKPYHKKSTTN